MLGKDFEFGEFWEGQVYGPHTISEETVAQASGGTAPQHPSPTPGCGGPLASRESFRYTVLSVPGATGLLPGAVTYGFPLGMSSQTKSGAVPHRSLAPGVS